MVDPLLAYLFDTNDAAQGGTGVQVVGSMTAALQMQIEQRQSG